MTTLPPPLFLLPQPVVQTIAAVQSAGVQDVANDVCSQLAHLVTSALYSGDTDSAARIIATAFVQGGPPPRKGRYSSLGLRRLGLLLLARLRA